MAVRIGYACINTVLQSPNRTCRINRVTPERIVDLARLNLAALGEILRWNQQHAIRLFRISSDTIPFASHPVNQEPWWEILRPELEELGNFILDQGMRVSMHPGQFTVLNSLRSEVVQSSIAELVYHARFLDALRLDRSHKIILHTGGVFGDKPASLRRFIDHYALLPGNVQARLVIENDEKNYSLADTLEIADRTGIPAVFDVFHHTWNPAYLERSRRDLVELAAETWRLEDGRPKIHYSDPWPGKPPGSHSQTVDLLAFSKFYEEIRDLELDIMLEVKDKQESVLAVYARFPELKAAGQEV